MPWHPAFTQAARAGCKVTITTRAGQVLAAANWDRAVPDRVARMMPIGWQEYVHHDDLPAVLAWFAMDGPGEPIVYRQLGVVNGRRRCCRFCLVKSWAETAWLVIGACEAE